VTTMTPGMQLPPGGQERLAAGSWRVDPARSHASFAASVVGRPVRGCLPLSGGVLITEPIEDSTALLIARAGAVTCHPAGTQAKNSDRKLISGKAAASRKPGPASRPPAACRSRTLSTTWPAISLRTLAAHGRMAPRASSSPAAGSSTPGG
jgi:hypothetical protein